MSGSFSPGETKIRPGVYSRIRNAGVNPAAATTNNVVAVIIQADWGRLNYPRAIQRESEIEPLFGSAGSTDLIKYILRQGAIVKAVRVGQSGTGTKATKTLVDTTGSPVNVVTITAKYVGAIDLRYTIRDSLTDSTKREFILYHGTSLLETIEFAKGSGGDGEPDALVDAINASSQWLDATLIAAGNEILATASGTAMTAGTNPTVGNSDYTTAMETLETDTFNVLALDTNTTAVHALAAAFIDEVYQYGKRAILVIGEPTSVAFATRCADAAAFNDHKVVYVANGYTDSSGVTYEGYAAAAVVAGLIAATPSNLSITHKVISGAVSIEDNLSNLEIETAIQSGAIVFSTNASGQIQVEYGISTLVTPDGDTDAGWKKIRRCRERFELLDRIDRAIDPLIGTINNDADGRSTIKAAGQGVINRMVNEGKLIQGQFIDDDNNPPQGDSAWFLVEVYDEDSVEKVYLVYNTRFSPTT